MFVSNVIVVKNVTLVPNYETGKYYEYDGKLKYLLRLRLARDEGSQWSL